MVEKKGVVVLTNEEKILEMLTGMQSQMDGMQKDIKNLNIRMDSLESKMDDLAESQAELRTTVNAILDWTDTVSGVIPIVPKIS